MGFLFGVVKLFKPDRQWFHIIASVVNDTELFTLKFWSVLLSECHLNLKKKGAFDQK